MQVDLDAGTFPVQALKEKALTSANRSYLLHAGLPAYCAPHLYFGPFADDYLPRLTQWACAADWKKGWSTAILRAPHAYVLGSAQNGEAIVLLPDDSGVYLFSEDGTELRMLNSNVECLAKAIWAFAEMVEAAWRHDEKAVLKQRIPRALVTVFADKFRAVEPSLSVSDSVWVHWAHDKSLNG